jgi:hypothetical protein
MPENIFGSSGNNRQNHGKAALINDNINNIQQVILLQARNKTETFVKSWGSAFCV